MNVDTVLRQVIRASRLGLRQYHAGIRTEQPSLVVQKHIRSGLLRTPPLCNGVIAHHIRRNSSATGALPLTNRESAQESPVVEGKDDIAARKAEEPAYQMTFTCKKCDERSSHRITKQAYHHGTTLITCPACKGRHLISDHLKIFSDKGITIEDILKEKGELLKKGRLGQNGDIEFYPEPEQSAAQVRTQGDKV